jgi:hypothetical protein
MALRAQNYQENQNPISMSKHLESSCSDFIKSCEVRCSTDHKVPLKLNFNCDNVLPHAAHKTPMKTSIFSLSSASAAKSFANATS